MLVLLDPETDRLRLDEAAFEALLSWHRRGADPGAMPAAFRAAGIGFDRLPDTVPLGLQAVAEPLCRLRLTLVDRRGTLHRAEGWLQSEAAALLLTLPDGLRDFAVLPTELVPAAAARVLGLGPRPRDHGDVTLTDATLLTSLRDPAEDVRKDAARRLSRHIPFRSDGWRVWWAESSWGDGAAPPAGRTLVVADTDSGYYVIKPDGPRSSLWPTIAADVWVRVIDILPDTDELDAPLTVRDDA